MAIVLHKRVVDRIDTDRWRAVEVYSCDKAEAPGVEASFWGGRLTGYGGFLPPEAVQVRTEPHKSPLKRYMVVNWESPTWENYISRHPPRAVLFRDASIAGGLPNTDQNGNVISGIDHTDHTGRKVWEIVRGRQAIAHPRALYRIYAAINSASVMGLVDLAVRYIGRVSKTYITHFGFFAGVGDSMLIAVRSRPRAGNPKVTMAAYDFLCMEGGWNNSARARQFIWSVVRQPVYDYEDMTPISGSFAKVAMLAPQTDTRASNTYLSTNFSALNHLLDWYM